MTPEKKMAPLRKTNLNLGMQCLMDGLEKMAPWHKTNPYLGMKCLMDGLGKRRDRLGVEQVLSQLPREVAGGL